MNPVASNQSNPLDPLTLVLARRQADEAGVSLSEHLARLVQGLEGPSGSRYGGMAEAQAVFIPPPARPSRGRDRSDDPASPALLEIAAFNARIDLAAMLLGAAFAEGGGGFTPSKGRRPRRQSPPGWYFDVVDDGIERAHQVKAALLHRWEPLAHAESLVMDAFRVLMDLTPSGRELLQIAQYDRPRAFSEMAAQLEVVTRQMEHAARLIVQAGSGFEVQAAGEDAFAASRATLLERAGGGMSLTQAAALLGMSRQAVHKRIKAGTILGLMDGAELVLPRGQFVQIGSGFRPALGLGDILVHFAVAGPWSALQFLVEADPNLGDVPLRVLTEGRIDAVVDAAKAYLGIDED